MYTLFKNAYFTLLFKWQESTHMCMNLRLYKYVFRQFADCYLLICLFSFNVVGIYCLLLVIVVLLDCLILNVHYFYLFILVCWQWVSVAKSSSSLIIIIHCCWLLILGFYLMRSNKQHWTGLTIINKNRQPTSDPWQSTTNNQQQKYCRNSTADINNSHWQLLQWECLFKPFSFNQMHCVCTDVYILNYTEVLWLTTD